MPLPACVGERGILNRPVLSVTLCVCPSVIGRRGLGITWLAVDFLVSHHTHMQWDTQKWISVCPCLGQFPRECVGAATVRQCRWVSAAGDVRLHRWSRRDAAVHAVDGRYTARYSRSATDGPSDRPLDWQAHGQRRWRRKDCPMCGHRVRLSGQHHPHQNNRQL